MDITPKPPSSPELKSNRSFSSNTSIISNLEDLKLETNKLYKAKVLKEIIEKDLPNLENKQATPEQKAKTQSQLIREWVLSVNGKLAKVSGNLPIQQGETLTVKVESPPGQKTNSLTIVQSINQNSSAIQSSQNLDTNILLSALTKLLPKQLSLSSGFAALNKINNAVSNIQTDPQLIQTNEVKTNRQTSTIGSTSAKVEAHTQKLESVIAKAVIDSLIRNLPQANQISQANQRHQEGNNLQTLQQILNKSGAFLESSLTSKTARTELANQLQNLRSLDMQLKSEMNQTINTQSTKGNPGPILSRETLNIIQQISKSTSLGSSQTVKVPAEDLKASLLGLTRLVTPTQTSGTTQATQASNLDKLLGQVIEPDLLSTPFNFPRVQSETTAKAQAILADQELSTGQLLKIIAGMLNRIQFNQLNSLYQSQSNEGNTLQSWFLELPVVNTNQEVNSFDIRIDKEKNPYAKQDEDSEDKALQWKLTLSFDFEELGAMYIQVSLLPPSISSVIWADREETYQLAQSEVKHFKEKLSELGLEVGDIFCQKGLPPQQTTKLTQSLVDVQA